MKTRWPVIKGSLAAVAIAILILDSKTALAGAQKGIALCIQTVIPSLFPFFVLSILLTGAIIGHGSRLFGPLCRLFSVPYGTEGLLAVGFFGGYPVGAQCVSQAFESGILSQEDARRMVVICNNCGPAFLFGMTATLFDDRWIPWLLWAVQIVSSCITARILSGKCSPVGRATGTRVTLIQALDRALKVMASVCGWVILFRVVLTFFEGWILWVLPLEVQVAVSGLLELSNGCFELFRLENVGLRFILCAGMLNFGGICVSLQTMAVTTERLDRSLYFPGKVFLCGTSLLLAWMIQFSLFPSEQRWALPMAAGILILISVVAFGFFLRKIQNKSSIPVKLGV